jgi:hypothetical protein
MDWNTNEADKTDYCKKIADIVNYKLTSGCMASISLIAVLPMNGLIIISFSQKKIITEQVHNDDAMKN